MGPSINSPDFFGQETFDWASRYGTRKSCHYCELGFLARPGFEKNNAKEWQWENGSRQESFLLMGRKWWLQEICDIIYDIKHCWYTASMHSFWVMPMRCVLLLVCSLLGCLENRTASCCRLYSSMAACALWQPFMVKIAWKTVFVGKKWILWNIHNHLAVQNDNITPARKD